MTTSRRTIAYGVVLALSAIAAVAAFETYHRLRLAERLHRFFDDSSFWIHTGSLTPSEAVDGAFGRTARTHPRGLFKVDTTVDLSIIPTTDGDRAPLHFSVRTNNVGLLSDRDYAFERDPARPEFRIAVLGESFTAPMTATYQWVDTLEEVLNQSADLRRAVGGRTIRTYNLGVVGGGFPTFSRVFLHSGRHFDPDLVVVNILEVDFARSDLRERLTDEAAMIAQAAEHLDAIRAAAPGTPLLVTVMPAFGDLVEPSRPYARVERLAAARPDLAIVDMRRHLPLPADAEALKAWTNLPLDGHYSDRGGEIYARSLAAVIARQVAGLDEDFSDAASRHGEAVLGAGRPRNRPLATASARFADDAAVLQRIRAAIEAPYVRGRMRRLRPYALDVLLGSGVDGVVMPTHRPVQGAFVPIRYGDGERQVVLLNIACLAPPPALDNPACYTFLHLYAGDRGG